MSASTNPQVHISLHDVTPFHQERVQYALEVLKDCGVAKCTLLVVPNFHHKAPLEQSPEFGSFLKSIDSVQTEFFLHGYYHLDDVQKSSNWRERLLRKFMTAGEGEFLSLGQNEVQSRLEKGLLEVQDLVSERVRGFVAPAWLYNHFLPGALRNTGIDFYENHHAIYNASARQEIKAPVITWATRDILRKYGSLIVCPLLLKKHKNEPLIRIAVHPHDFDHPETVKNIRKVIKNALEARKQVSVAELW